MKIDKRENFWIIEDDKSSVNGFSNYIENIAYKQFKDQNVIIDLLKYDELKLEELLGFLRVSNRHRQKKHSFVIVNDTLLIDQIPDELAVVPTMQEAEDFIQMEELERELGF